MLQLRANFDDFNSNFPLADERWDNLVTPLLTIDSLILLMCVWDFLFPPVMFCLLCSSLHSASLFGQELLYMDSKFSKWPFSNMTNLKHLYTSDKICKSLISPATAMGTLPPSLETFSTNNAQCVPAFATGDPERLEKLKAISFVAARVGELDAALNQYLRFPNLSFINFFQSDVASCSLQARKVLRIGFVPTTAFLPADKFFLSFPGNSVGVSRHFQLS